MAAFPRITRKKEQESAPRPYREGCFKSGKTTLGAMLSDNIFLTLLTNTTEK